MLSCIKAKPHKNPVTTLRMFDDIKTPLYCKNQSKNINTQNNRISQYGITHNKYANAPK